MFPSNLTNSDSLVAAGAPVAKRLTSRGSLCCRRLAYIHLVYKKNTAAATTRVTAAVAPTAVKIAFLEVGEGDDLTTPSPGGDDDRGLARGDDAGVGGIVDGKNVWMF